MAFDTARNLIWQVAVGGDNGIYGLDPADGSVEQVITGSPWDDISQRGLAYDPDTDVFYIGGWNEGIVYRVAGPSHPTPGETLNQCSPPDFAISGLAWNRSFGMLWQATNSETDTIFLVDPMTCEASVALPHPGRRRLQRRRPRDRRRRQPVDGRPGSGNAYLIESGLPTFSDVPWLTVAPTEATIAPDGSIDVDDHGRLDGSRARRLPGARRDPDQRSRQSASSCRSRWSCRRTSRASTPVAADDDRERRPIRRRPRLRQRPVRLRRRELEPEHRPPRSTGPRMTGCTRTPVGMTSYRFDVPDGIYRVDLRFAEIQPTSRPAPASSM